MKRTLYSRDDVLNAQSNISSIGMTSAASVSPTSRVLSSLCWMIRGLSWRSQPLVDGCGVQAFVRVLMTVVWRYSFPSGPPIFDNNSHQRDCMGDTGCCSVTLVLPFKLCQLDSKGSWCYTCGAGTAGCATSYLCLSSTNPSHSC